MNPPSTSDFSVYQLALETLAPPQPFSVSPATLKSLVGALIDVLIEEKISSQLWVKIPPTEDWQAELKRYRQMVGVPHKIYLCSCFGERLVEGTNGVERAANVNADSQCVSVQLAAGSQLKREYFLIVLSDKFSGLIVAYQPESVAAANLRKSQPLLAICTFERQVIQRVLEGITGVIAVDDTTPKELLERWESVFPLLDASDQTALLTQVLVKQVQRTEEILKRRPIDKVKATPPSSSNVLRNMDALVKRVAQELRTPLASMKTALRLLDSTGFKPPQRQRYMQLLHTECDRQTSLITGLLELVQLEGEPQPTVMQSVQLTDIVPGVVSTYQPIAQEKGIQLGYNLSAGLPAVSCLETSLRQIIINLLRNSLKYTPTGGEVMVRGTLQGEYVQLAISDTGIGLAASEIPRIFDSFYRGRSTTSEDTGAGLGLTIVKQLLRRCGGSITVTSQLGEGSTFKVLLPVASQT